jgi:hypothetical protein
MISSRVRRRARVSRLEILEAEYKRALENPLFDNPAEYCVLLDLIKDEIDRWYKV